MSKASKPLKIKFVNNGRQREKGVTLEWPLEVDGKRLNFITVRRLKAKEVAALQEAMQGDGVPEMELIEMFSDQPAAIIAELDQDDLVAVKEVVFDFLPRTVRAALEAAAQDAELQTGEHLQPTSPTPSSGAEKTS